MYWTRLLKLAKMIPCFSNFSIVAEKYIDAYKNPITRHILHTTIVFFLCAHFYACFWFEISGIYDFQRISLIFCFCPSVVCRMGAQKKKTVNLFDCTV